jgi:branched-subunit amino acid transport protein
MNSLFLSLNKKDFLKGLVVAVLTAVITVIYTTIESGTLTFDWKAIAMAALSAALAYITKNLLTNSEDKFLAKDPA